MKFFTRGDLASQAHVSERSIYNWIRDGWLPPPDVSFGLRMFYSQAQYQIALKALEDRANARRNKLFSPKIVEGKEK